MIIVAQDRGIYANKGSKEALRICTEIYYQSKEIDYSNGMIQADMTMSAIYLGEQNYKAALEKILRGKSLAKETDNYYLLSMFLIREAFVYSELGYTKKSQKALTSSLGLLNKLSEKEGYLIKSLVDMTKANNIQVVTDSTKDSTLIYLNRGYQEIKRIDNKNPYQNFFLGIFTIRLAEAYYLKNNFSKSELFLREFEIVKSHDKNQSEFIRYYILKGDIENKKKNYTQALEYFDKAQEFYQKYKMYNLALKDIYSGKAESYLMLNDFKNQAIYSTKAKRITDSIAVADRQLLNSTIDTNENEDPFADNENNNYYLAAGILIALAGLTFYILHRKNSRKEYTEEKLQEPIPQPIILHENEKSETEVEALRELVQLAKNDDKSFLLRFSEVFPTFNQRLLNINPQLTHSDLEYCALIKLKFDTKEIARHKNLTINSVVSKKYRIRKKLNISTDENMYTWMLNIG
ncbi:helix-turn-helix transcriptional regulator [Chryseobacterium indologenes]|jgi:DNA-binding CsgD family transcriptional regulator/lipopolysaccharide biosynthesis regulator YciM|uniref:helix-turn-helix transcriptional regulator n=1 Tax=Chryseobacterium indologenes TaxID=253 RepID=UPI001BCE1D02|nr:hypothetical protein [Chryseobacterium indologenes]